MFRNVGDPNTKITSENCFHLKHFYTITTGGIKANNRSFYCSQIIVYRFLLGFTLCSLFLFFCSQGCLQVEYYFKLEYFRVWDIILRALQRQTRKV